MNEVYLKIYGEVHGVGFRYQARVIATKLKLTGFVRNLPDGSVEIRAQGERDSLDQFITWVKGSSPGITKKIESKWGNATAPDLDFVII